MPLPLSQETVRLEWRVLSSSAGLAHFNLTYGNELELLDEAYRQELYQKMANIFENGDVEDFPVLVWSLAKKLSTTALQGYELHLDKHLFLPNALALMTLEKLCYYADKQTNKLPTSATMTDSAITFEALKTVGPWQQAFRDVMEKYGPSSIH